MGTREMTARRAWAAADTHCHFCRGQHAGHQFQFWGGDLPRPADSPPAEPAAYKNFEKMALYVCLECAGRVRRRAYRPGLLGWGGGFVVASLGVILGPAGALLPTLFGVAAVVSAVLFAAAVRRSLRAADAPDAARLVLTAARPALIGRKRGSVFLTEAEYRQRVPAVSKEEAAVEHMVEALSGSHAALRKPKTGKHGTTIACPHCQNRVPATDAVCPCCQVALR